LTKPHTIAQIGKGSGERLKWSHEDARSLIVSKLLN
jgi:hypothetical protein